MNVSGAVEGVSGEQAQPLAAGILLAQAREAQQLTVADVAAQLKLSPAQVNALEAGAFERLPGPVFVRGFIRNYARLLQLDAQPLLSSIEAQLTPAPREDAPPSPEIPFPGAAGSGWRNLGLAAAVLLIVSAIYEFWPAAEVENFGGTAPVAGLTATESVAVNPLAGAGMPTDAPSSHEPPVSVSETMPAPAGSGQLVEQKPVRAAAPVVSGQAVVHLIFKNESWVQIMDRAGRIIFSQMNHAGSEQQVHGMPPLSVVVGNSRGVLLLYNKKPIDLAQHTKVDVARLTLE